MTEPTEDQSSLPSISGSTPLLGFLRSLSQKLSLAVILISIAVILGWVFAIPLLKSLLPGLPTMKVNTSVCFILGGSSLWLWHQSFKHQEPGLDMSAQPNRIRRQNRKATISRFLIFNLAFLMILIASLTLIQYGFNISLGLDQLLMQQPEPIGSTAVPGRMAPNTAFAFLSAGAALLLLNSRRSRIGLAQSMAVVTWLVSFVGLLGHVYGSVYFYMADSYTGMAIHTAIAFQLISIGILCALPDRGLMLLVTSNGAGSLMMRRLLPTAMLLALVVGGLSSLGYRLNFYGQEIEAALSSTLQMSVFAVLVSWNAQSLNRFDLRRRQAEQALQQANANLEQQIEERTLRLRQSEQELRAIFEAEPECVKVMTADGILQNMNPAGLAMIEAENLAQVFRQSIYSLIEPSHQSAFATFTTAVTQGRSGSLEFEIIGLKGTRRWMESHAVPLNVQGEPVPLVLAVTRDVTDRKQAEASLNQLNQELEERIAERTAELQQTNDRLQQELFKREQAERELQQTLVLQNAILSSANYSIISTTVDGTISSFNAGAEKMLGYSATEVVGKLTPAFIHDPQEVAAHAQLLSQELGVEIEPGFGVFVTKAKRGEVAECEWSYIRKDGSQFPVLLSVTALRDRAGNLTGVLGIGTDMTDRKQAEAERREMLVALENTVSGISRLDAQGCYIAVNQAYASAGGYSPAEMIGMDWQRTVHPDDLEKLVAAYEQMLQDGKVEVEAKGIRKDGSLFYKQLVMISIYDEQHQFIGHHCFMKDISDRKQTEASLAYLAAIVEHSGDAIISKSLDSTILSWNSAAERIFGYRADEMIGQSITRLIPADLTHEEQQILKTIRRGGIVDQYETVRVRKDGQQIYISVTVSPLKDSTGKIIGASATKRDISDRKQAEDERKRMEVALRNSEEQFRHAFEDASIGMAIVSLDGHWLKANPALCQIIGYTIDELLPLTFQDITHPNDLAADLIYVDQLLADEISTYQLEKRYFHKQGHIVWILLNGSLVKDVQGNPLHFIAQIQDITTRKHIEAQLRKSEANLLEAQRVAHVGSWEVDLNTQQIIWSEELFRMFGFDPADPEPSYDEHFNYIHPDDRDLLQTHITQATENGTPYEVDLRFFRTDGTMGYMEAKGRTVKNEQGQIVRLFGTALDISDRKRIEAERQQVEESLRESEARFHAFMDHSPAAAWITDANGVMLYASGTYCRTFQVPTTDLIGRSVFDLFPLEIAQQFLDNIQAVVQTQQVVETIEIAPRSDGTLGDFLVYKFSVPDGLGRGVVGGVAIDITLQHRAEIALQKSEERLQLALEASGDGLWDWNVATGDVYYSPQFMTMLGYEADELPQNLETWKYLTHPDDQAWVLDILNAHMQDSSVPYAFDYRVRIKAGGWKWIANYGKVVAHDTQVNPLRMIGTHKDISDRKYTETALQESLDRERAIAEVIQHMRQTLDLETIFGATTQELRRVLHCDRVLVYRFNPDWSGAVVAESVGSGWVSVIATLMDSDNPSNSQELERDRCIIKAWDSQEAKTNDTYIQETGGGIYLEGIKHSRVTDIYQANFDPCYIKFLETLQAQAYLTVPIFSNQKLWGLLASYQNSSPRAWHQSEIQVSGQIGTQLGIAIQQAELFAQIQQQSNELQRAKEAAEVANRAKSVFLANMSHELRTPLNVILGFTQVMNHDASLPPEQQEHVQIIHRSGEHLLTLINDVLDLSKIEAERTTFDQSNFDVVALLRSLWEMLRLKAETKGLQLNLDIAEDVPQHITTDPNKLRQTLINLLGNAIKFTETGTVTLRVRMGEWESGRDTASPHPPTPHTLLFEVEDTGIGVTAADLETIFDAFMQAQAGKTLTDGTGLGLTISRRFVQLMGGDLTASSTPGQGSTFRFNIPIQVVNAAEVPLPKTQQRIIGLAPGQPLYRILVVDDQPENRQLLVKLLTQLGLEVRQACDGEEAIALTAQWHPHLVWMDMRMPKVDGYEATQAIRATPEGQEIAIIALTAQASCSDRTLALSSGCNDYLSKPFKEDELFTKMAEHLGLSYVYEDQQERSAVQTNGSLNSMTNSMTSAGRTQSLALTPSDLKVMPSAWLIALQQAAQHCDDEEVSYLIEQIPQNYATLSGGLNRLAHDFQFKQIVQLIQASANSLSE